MAREGVITEFHSDLLKAVGRSPLKELFYLSGGTALAEFYLGHRYSEDLDFFTSIEMHLPKLPEILTEISKSVFAEIEIQRSFEHFAKAFFTRDNDTIATDWVCDTPFRLGKTLFDEELGIHYDDIDDIGANKISALFDRADIKDFVDLFFLDKEGYSFGNLFEKANEKHVGLDRLWMVYALEQINHKEKLPRMIKPVSIEELRDHFLKIAKELEVF